MQACVAFLFFFPMESIGHYFNRALHAVRSDPSQESLTQESLTPGKGAPCAFSGVLFKIRLSVPVRVTFRVVWKGRRHRVLLCVGGCIKAPQGSLLPRPASYTCSADLVTRPGPQTWSTDLLPTVDPQGRSLDQVPTSGPQTWSANLVPRSGPHTSSPSLVLTPGPKPSPQSWSQDLVCRSGPKTLSPHLVLGLGSQGCFPDLVP